MCNIWECGAKIGKHFRRNIFITEKEELRNFRAQYNNTDVFCSVLKYDSAEDPAGALKYGPLYFDLDGEDFEKVREDAKRVVSYLYLVLAIDYENMRFYFSGRKGIHIMVPPEALGVKPSVDLNQVYHLIALGVIKSTSCSTLDLVIYDARRLFRLPNSKHGITGLYKIPLTYEEMRTLTAEQIYALAARPRYIKYNLCLQNVNTTARIIKENFSVKKYQPVQVFKGAIKDIGLPACVAYLLKNPPDEGRRNATCIALASYYFQRGLDRTAVLDKLTEWGERTNPPMDRGEIIKVIGSEYKGGYHYGCTTFKQLAPCDASCKFWKVGRNAS